jgi:hypothetical protein
LIAFFRPFPRAKPSTKYRSADFNSNYFLQPRIGDIDFKVKTRFKIEDWLTPTAMLSRARR